ncbi:MAG: PaaI family thioesterase [bacterium]|nr:PaaI family thioesterase [bacterium]
MTAGARPAAPGFWSLLGMAVESADDDAVVVTMTAPDDFLSPFGTVHGGLVATFFDTALAVAIARRLGASDRIATHNLNVTYVSFTRERRLRCRACVVSLRTTVAVVEGEVTTDEGTLVAKALGTFGVRRTPPAVD